MKGEFIMKTNMINSNSVIKSICAVVMLLGMSVSAWGADETLTVTGTFIGSGSGYGSSDGKNLATGASHNVSIAYTDVLKGQSYLQLKGSTGVLYSKSLPASSSNNKIKTITIATVSGNSILLYGSTATDNTGWTAISYTANTAADVSSYNYKTFKIESSGGYASTPSVTVVYTVASPQTVTFEKEGGEFDDPSVFTNTNQITEDEGGAGVTLPLVNPTASMSSMGWGFYGWATSAVGTPTTTAPTTIVGKAGDTYYPQSATTLYAVFAKGEFTKITSESQITSGGKYLIAGWYNSQIHMMTSTYIYTDDYYMKEKVVSEYTSGKIRAIDIDGTWRYTITGSSNAYFIQDVVHNSNNYIDTYNINWYNCSYSSTHSYQIVFDGGTCYIKNNQGSYPYLVLFAKGDFGTVSSVWAGMLLYKETTECMFASNPKTVKVVASPAEGGLVDLDIVSAQEYVFSDDDYEDFAEAAENSGYEFLRWETSNATNAKFYDGSAYTLTTSTDATAQFKATGDATLTAYFYKNCSVTYTLTGLTKLTGVTNVDAATNASGFTATFSVNDHYRTTPLTCSVTMGGSTLTSGTDYTWNASTKTLTIPAATDITGDLVITISAEHTEYTKYAFSCAELTLTPVLATASTPIFITSAANKTVRSQDKIQISGNGLTPTTILTFPGLPSKFAIKKADGTALATNGSGVIEEDAYIFYTPDAEDETDGLDKLTGITVSVGGAKPKTVNLTQDIIGRHLPADFVIAVKRNNKWYALPATMDELTNPSPVEISVDDINNPSIAYTAASNIYNLYGQNSGSGGKLYTNGETVKLGMKNNSNKPLFGAATGSSTVKGDGTAIVTNNIGQQYWWTLTQTATTITNPQDAQYGVMCSNNTAPFVLKENAGNPQWGFFTTGSVGPIRLIPASDISFTAASVVEWGQHSAIVEANPTAASGIDATSVVAHLNGAESSAIELFETKSSVKGGATKYNYTVNFGDAIDFAAAASNGAMLTLEWKNGATVKAMSNIVVPKIVASTKVIVNSTNYPTKSVWETEVHVLPGDTLEIDASGYAKKVVTISELNIYPGATVKIVGTNDSLNVRSLVLRNGWTRVGTKRYDVARLYVGTSSYLKKANNKDGWYSDWYIDYDQYYPIAVPFPVATSSISYKNASSAARAGVKLRYYSGELRAAHIQENQADNWVEYTWDGTMPTNLEPSHGYIMTAKRPTGKAFSIVRMPLTFSNDWTALGEKGEVGGMHKDQVTVTAWGDGSTPSYAKGWNIIANPYMALHQGALSYTDASGDYIEFANIPDINFKEYDQLPIETTKLKPASAFLVQAPKTGTVTFGATNRKASAPSYRQEIQAETYPRQKAYIVLNNEQSEDMMGILVSDKYTAEYELNADLEKLLGDGTSLKTYMQYGDRNMAYVAINEVLAREWIPVTVRIPESGEYTYSLHEASIAGELEGIYLIDYESNTVTNLIEDNYSFVAAGGTIADRFAINAIVGKHNTPTDIDIINAGGDINSKKPVKFIWDDKVFILHNGVIYDSTGKRVREINR